MTRQGLTAAVVCSTLVLSSLCLPVVGQQAGRASLIRNGSFDTDIAGWSAWFAPGQSEGQAEWVERNGGGAMSVTVERRDTSSAVQIFQGPFTVQQGAWYAVSFEAKAESPMSARVSLMRHSPPYGPLGLNADVSLGTEWETISLLAQATADSDDARIDLFPENSFLLDNMVIEPLGEEPDRWPVNQVRPGPEWQGNAGALVDGDPESRVNSRYYPVLPLLITLDLGEARPVGAVIVQGLESGRHSSVAGIDVEVSADGQAWFRWARCAKSSEGNVAGVRSTVYLGTNVAVPVRWVRLRIARLRGAASLAEAEVIAARGASEGALSRLPRVRPEENVAFLGWDYDRLGYAASPGEKVALRFRNQGDGTVDVPVPWRLESYIGDEVARGEGQCRVGLQATTDVGFSVPPGLADGPHRVRFRLGEAEAEEALYFDHRVARPHDVLGLRLAAVMDNVEPEGWVKLISGVVKRFVDVRRSLPDDPAQVDAALVMAESWPDDAPVVQTLRQYVRSGGRALFYGKVSTSLVELLPVEIDYHSPWLETPQRLKPPTFWPGFDPDGGPRHYGVRAKAKPGAGVLAEWSDGTPALVEGRYGQGRVLYLGAAPGRTWQWRPGLEGADELSLRALYYLVGRQDAPKALLRLAAERAKAEEGPEGVSSGNVGRFGWLIEEGGLVENLTRDAEIRSPARHGTGTRTARGPAGRAELGRQDRRVAR